MAYFSQFNREFTFELPEELTSKPKEEKYMSILDAHEKYLDAVLEVIAFGISINRSPKAKTERNGWIATQDEIINVPGFQIPEIEKMLNDNNAVKLCKQGRLGVEIVGYENEWGQQYKVKWTDR